MNMQIRLGKGGRDRSETSSLYLTADLNPRDFVYVRMYTER